MHLSDAMRCDPIRSDRPSPPRLKIPTRNDGLRRFIPHATARRAPHIPIPPLFLLDAGEAPLATLDLHGHGELGVRVAALVVLCADGGDEVDGEAPDVEGVDEGDDPFEDGGRVPPRLAVADAEADGHAELDDDEGELEPEGDAQDAVLSVVDSEALVFPADEDGREDVSAADEGGLVCFRWG